VDGIMVERLARLREPVAVVLLLVLVLRLVGAVVDAVTARGSGVDGAGPALVRVASQATDPLTVVVLTFVIGISLLWSPTRHARGLALGAFAITVIGVLLSLVASVALLATGVSAVAWTDVARLVLQLVLPVLALIVLPALLQRGREEADAPLSLEPSPAAETAAQRQVEPRRDPANEPVWQPDQAAGAAWLKAGDAASGAAATGWGTPGGASGWAPAERPTGPATPGPLHGEQDQHPTS
jgi:hypothetical protein